MHDAALITLPDGNHGFAISAFYAGPMDEAERVLQPLRRALPTAADRIAPISYVQLQKAGDASFPRGHRFYWKAQFLRQITEAAADALIDRFPLRSVPAIVFRVPTSRRCHQPSADNSHCLREPRCGLR